MDSYYLSKEARDELNNKNTNFLAQIPRSKNEELWKMADQYVTTPGEYAHFYNIFSHESLTCYNVQHPKETKKVVFAISFLYKIKELQKTLSGFMMTKNMDLMGVAFLINL